MPGLFWFRARVILLADGSTRPIQRLAVRGKVSTFPHPEPPLLLFVLEVAPSPGPNWGLPQAKTVAVPPVPGFPPTAAEWLCALVGFDKSSGDSQGMLGTGTGFGIRACFKRGLSGFPPMDAK